MSEATMTETVATETSETSARAITTTIPFSKLAAIDEINARRLFQPADYFKRAAGAFAKIALEEMGEHIPKGGKKAELAEAAAAAARMRGWLPVQLRHPDYALLPKAQNSDAAEDTNAEAADG